MNQVLKQVIGKIGDLDYCLIGSGNLKYQGIAIEPDDLDFLIDEAGIEQVAKIFNSEVTTNEDHYQECEFIIRGVEVHFVTPSGLRDEQLGQRIILEFYQRWNRPKDQEKIRMIKEKLGL